MLQSLQHCSTKGCAMKTVRVGMTLTERDCNNVEKLRRRAELRTKAQAVSLALSVAEFMVTEWEKGSTFVLRNKTTGELQKIIPII